MSTIKDALDLIIVLEKRVKDRPTLDLLFPIKEKIFQAERENFEIEKSFFAENREIITKHDAEKEKINTNHRAEITKIESDHKEKIMKLTSDYNDKLNKVMSNHHAEIVNLESELAQSNFELEKIKKKRANNIQKIRA